MGGRAGHLPGLDVKRDQYMTMHQYISHIYHVPFIWKECLPGRFSSRLGKTGSWFAQPGSRQKVGKFLSRKTLRPADDIREVQF